ncbi:MAG: hypothetical protein GY757_60880 [bacterium]|nr:hypothetical protein [bacterium]
MILLLSEISFSQTLSFFNATEKEGLPGSFILCIQQDSRGYFWFGTGNGASCYDGYQFKNYSKKDGLPDNNISNIVEDWNGNLWFIIYGRKLCRLRDGRFESCFYLPEIYGNHIHSCVATKDGLLLATVKGLILFDGKEFKSYTIDAEVKPATIKKIARAKNGTLWLAAGNFLGYFSNDGLKKYATDDSLSEKKVFAMLPDSKKRIWLGTSNGLICFQEGAPVSYTTNDGLSHNRITTLLEDDDGNIWIGTWNGITLFDGKRFIAYTTKNGLIHNFILSAAKDPEGNIWFGTIGGLSCLKSMNISTYTVNSGLANNFVNTIIEDRQGRIWAGTHEGLHCFANGKIKSYTKDEKLISNVINFLMEDRKGNIWVATVEGISVFSSGHFTNYSTQDGLSGNVVFRFYEDRAGNIWIGNGNGIDCFKNGKFTRFPLEIENIEITTFLEDSKGELWFSSSKGLFHYHGSTLTQYTIRDGLPDNSIHALTEDHEGNLWLCTENGLSCYKEGKFINYSTKNGMPANKCQFALEDDKKKLWIGTTGGLTCFDGVAFRNYSAKRHGLATDNWFSGIQDSRGTLWLGSSRGITRLTLPLKTNKVPPPIHITRVKVMDKELPISEFHHLNYDRNYVRFEFAGLCYSTPDSVMYKYQLEGVDNGWQETANRSVFYYLQPGKYRFKVKAFNNDGIESTEPATLSFEVIPAFWQTWWFKSLVFLFVLSIVGMLILWRYKRTMDKAELKNRTKQLMTSQRMELMGTLAAGTVHDLKNLLSIIMGYSQVMEQSSGKDDDNYKNIEIIKDTTGTAMHMAKQILNFSRLKTSESGDVELIALLDEILMTLEITRPKWVQFLWEPPSGEFLFNIDPVRFQQLVMNLCLNAIHAMPRGGELEIVLSRSENADIALTFSDTGTGIDPGAIKKIFEPLYTTKTKGKGTGLGLFVVKQIVEEHNGKIDVQSSPGKGTTFTICFPC